MPTTTLFIVLVFVFFGGLISFAKKNFDFLSVLIVVGFICAVALYFRVFSTF